MMETRILNDTTERKLTVIRTQDVEPILDLNKELRAIQQKSDWGRHIATIPNVIIERWLNEEWERGNPMRMGGAEFDAMVERKLQDPDWKFLRTDKTEASQVGW